MVFVVSLIETALALYIFIIVGRFLLSWLPLRSGTSTYRIYSVLDDASEPYLRIFGAVSPARAVRQRRARSESAGGAGDPAPRPDAGSGAVSAREGLGQAPTYAARCSPVRVERAATRSAGCALEDDPAAVVARAGAEVDDPVGVRHDRLVVLDHDDRLAGVDEPVEQAEQLLDVGQVQAGGRLVEHVDAALLAHVGGELEPLPLAAGQRRERLAEAEVAEPDVGEPAEDGVRGRRARLAGAEERRPRRRPTGRAPRRCRARRAGSPAPTAWKRRPSQSSQVVATLAMKPRSV